MFSTKVGVFLLAFIFSVLEGVKGNPVSLQLCDSDELSIFIIRS